MKLDKVLKEIGEDTKNEMEAMDSVALEKLVVVSEQSMKQAKDELEANEKYKEIKESKKALEEGMKAVNKRQKAKIAFALHLLEKE